MLNLSEEDQVKYTSSFQKAAEENENNNGQLNVEDFEKLLATCGFILSRAELMTIFVEIDTDQNWTISLDEFLEFISQVAPSGSPVSIAAGIRCKFNEQDINKDGYISLEELKTVLAKTNHNVSEDWLRTFIEDWDKDGDGKINFEEFVTMFVKTELIDSVDDEGEDVEYEKEATDLTETFVSADKIRSICKERNLIEDGMVSVEDLKTVLTTVKKQLAEGHFEACVNTLDEKGTGKVRLEEFVCMFEELLLVACEGVEVEGENREGEGDTEQAEQRQEEQRDEEQTQAEEREEQEEQTGQEQTKTEEREDQREKEKVEEMKIHEASEEKEDVGAICRKTDSDIAKISARFEGKRGNKGVHVSGDDGAREECKAVGVKALIARLEKPK